MAWIAAAQITALLGIITHHAIPNSDAIESNLACVVYAALVSLTDAAMLLISLVFPLRGMSEWNRNQTRVNRAQSRLSQKVKIKLPSSTQTLSRSDTVANISKEVNLITLISVFKNPELFDMFVEHLSVELGIESLVFLIEVWQFKFADRIPSFKKLAMVMAVRRGVSARHDTDLESLSVSADRTDSRSSVELSSIVIEDDEKQEKLKSRKNSVQRNRNSIRRNSIIGTLIQINWTDLPLSDAYSVAPRNKAKQALWIFDCYVSRNAFDRINIGGKAYVAIHAAAKVLCPGYEYSSNRRSSMGLTGLKVGQFDISIPQSFDTEPDRQCGCGCSRRNRRGSEVSRSVFTKKTDIFQSVTVMEYDDVAVRNTFDCALPDILGNLNDSLMRFKQSKSVLQYILTHQSIFKDDEPT